MKSFKSIFSTFCAGLMVLIVAMGCSNENNSLAGPDASSASSGEAVNLSKKKSGFRAYNTNTSTNTYPLYGNEVVSYFPAHDEYKGATVNVQGSNTTFSFPHGSLTPPVTHPWGDPLTITIMVENDPLHNELIYTFGPSGSTFIPAARILLDYSALGGDMVPDLFYIDGNGNYIQQQPDNIDFQGKWIEIFVDHFSRYALVRG